MDTKRHSPASLPRKNYFTVTNFVILMLCTIFIGQSLFIGIVIFSKEDSVDKLLMQTKSWVPSSSLGKSPENPEPIDGGDYITSSTGSGNFLLNPSKILKKQSFLG